MKRLTKKRKKFLDSLSIESIERGLMTGELDDVDRSYVLGMYEDPKPTKRKRR